jgi:L-alanine-DL-glutamate epimerase-like enolase superfamily enzyme
LKSLFGDRRRQYVMRGERQMKITNLQCMVLRALRALVVRIDTDEGISGLAQVEASKHAYLTPHVLTYKPYLLGQDPTNVERVMLRIRRFGAFKPWGSSVSAIEMALWDIAGQAAGVPVYKLLGGKVRDRVRVYNGGDMPYAPSGLQLEGTSPEDYFRHASARKKLPGGFTIMKWAIGFHSRMASTVPGYHYGEPPLPPTPPTSTRRASPRNGA